MTDTDRPMFTRTREILTDFGQDDRTGSPLALAAQPVSSIQWVPASALSANDWNPNKQAPPEFRLLKQSLLEDGWTQPIVVRAHDDGARLEIVDGFHRWTLASKDKQVGALTTVDGQVLVPVVTLHETSDQEARASTIRHNRARGTHLVLRMADIVAALVKAGMTTEQVQKQLGMDEEEVERLLDRGNMLNRGSRTDGSFGTGWTV